ncbi:dentin sialophosphoprotein isoform X1 [Homalodisca vitripennis]|nr:dentin sialophosphoprotein isoform X1 [Homalodisca vitripennis]
MEIVNFDLNKYLQRNIFPSRTVLVFPPFNGFRRFLIHKLIEDNFASSEVAAFSIGQDIGRRIVVCYRGLIRENELKGTSTNLSQKAGNNMIEREKQNKQKLTPTAAVYRPPAARLAESRQNSDNSRTPESKRSRVRRPDQQMYVPRPKRASFGSDQPRSRSRSSSRTSLENDSCDKRIKTSPQKSEESRLSGSDDPINNRSSEVNATELPTKLPFSLESCSTDKVLPLCSSDISAPLENIPVIGNEELRPSENIISNDLRQVGPSRLPDVVKDKDLISTQFSGKEVETEVSELSLRVLQYASSVSEYVETKINNKVPLDDSSKIENDNCAESENQVSRAENKDGSFDSEDNSTQKREVKTCEKTEAMETISISSDSQDQNSNSVTTSSSDSRNSDSSDSELKRKLCRRKSNEEMEIDHSINSEKKKDFKEDRNASLDQNHKTRRIFPSVPVSDVLIISDSSSCDDVTIKSKEPEPKIGVTKEKLKKSPAIKEKSEKVANKSKSIDPGECDWESLYDDTGECLVPDLMEELTNSVGRVRVTSVDSDYRPYQSIEERTSDGECVIEIYDFPAEFKTTDLFNIFAAYRNKNFQIKWVDDTHALGVFPSPLMADEVLACTLPYVKTRPLRMGIAESRNKARNLVLPPLPAMERPKTCTALARRLVSGALGLRLPTSSQDRERERQVLKEAREKRRQEVKQREAAWDGTLTKENCV